jgi:HAE1 family hydrophobic/amphiphilic exporter-1
MERITQWAFRNRAAVIVSVVLALVMGLVSYFTLPKEFLPAVDAPNITVTVTAPGFDAATMADEVAAPIEQAVASIPGKTTVMSTSADGFTSVNILFDTKTKMKDAKLDVQDALSNVTLPDGASKPNVVQLNTSQIPVADVAVTFDDGINDQNLSLVRKKIVPAIQDIPGVSAAMVYGDNPNQVVVHLDKQKLAQYRLPLQSVMGVLQGQNLTTAVGEKDIAGDASTIRVIGKVDSLSALRDLNVVPGVKLGDIATVDLQPSSQNITHVNGKSAVLVIVSKTPDANAVAVGQDVKKVAQQLSSEYGPKVHVEVPFATATMVLNSVNSMMREVLMGALFATVVILLFLRSVRMTLITIVSIPLSLGLTLFLLSKSGITLNIITLGAVAVAVGRLVDDSIVVIENIYRKSQTEGYSKDTVIHGTKEVASAITSSTLTTIAVFLPMGLIQGSLQQLMLPFALTIVYSLLSSLLVALAVVPLMSSGMLKNAKLRQHRRPERFMRFIRWNLQYKWLPLTLAAVFFVGSVGAYILMPKGAVDSSDRSWVEATLNYPTSTPLDEVKAGAERLEKILASQPEAKDTLLMLGNSSDDAKYGNLKSPTLAKFDIVMKDGADAEAFIRHVQEHKSEFPNATLSVYVPSGFAGGNTINIDLYGDNADNLVKASTQVMDAVKGIDGVTKVSSNQQDVKPSYEIKVNPSVANAQEIAMQLRSVLNQVPIGSIKLDGQDTKVVLDSTESPKSLDDLKNIPIVTKTGVVKLSDVATVTRVEKPGTVLRKDGNEFVEVNVVVDPKKLSEVTAKIHQQTRGLKLPSGVTMSIGGASTEQANQFSDLFKTMGVAIGVVYLIMVLTFKSLRAPLAILFSLPLAAIGAVLGLMVSNTPADPTALIGALMLIGIVVTNAIVLIDKVKQNEQHMIIRDALVEAAATRMRPILMTAVATVCAMLPLVFGKTEEGSLVSKGLAVVVIGGLSVATLLTLVIVPSMYELLYFLKSRRQRKAQARSATVTVSPNIAP